MKKILTNIVSIIESFNPFRIPKIEIPNDKNSLRKDWEKIGEDFHKVIDF